MSVVRLRPGNRGGARGRRLTAGRGRGRGGHAGATSTAASKLDWPAPKGKSSDTDSGHQDSPEDSVTSARPNTAGTEDSSAWVAAIESGLTSIVTGTVEGFFGASAANAPGHDDRTYAAQTGAEHAMNAAATAVGGKLEAGEECIEVGVFPPDALPELAFPNDAAIMDAWLAHRAGAA